MSLSFPFSPSLTLSSYSELNALLSLRQSFTTKTCLQLGQEALDICMHIYNIEKFTHICPAHSTLPYPALSAACNKYDLLRIRRAALPQLRVVLNIAYK